MSGLTEPIDVQQKQTRLNLTYRAVVRNNNDPDKKQRLQIEIPNLFEGQVSDLPWAMPKSKDTGTGAMSVKVPPVGSYVLVTFDDENPHFPYWTGGLLAAYSLDSGSPLATDYPNRWGESASVTSWYFDMTSGDFVLQADAAQAKIVLKRDGNITVDAATKITVTAPTIEVDGSSAVDVNCGDCNVTATGAVLVQSSSTTTVSATDSLTLHSASSVVISSGGDITLSATGDINMS